MTQPTSKQIFLSYSRTDLAAADVLRAALEQAGFEVFKDDASIRGGERWLTRLQQAVAGCAAFVVLVGRDGVRRWVGAEVEVALLRHLSPHDDGERLPIFPLLLGDTAPEALPPFLALFQATGWSAVEPLPQQVIDDLRAGVSRFHPSAPFEGCPFLGLNAFGRKDARLFFGRRAETLEALACLGDQQEGDPENLSLAAGGQYRRWLQIEGNSGNGKSSLVQAGMLPMIEQGALWARTGFELWTLIGPMMPGRDPLAMLAEKLAQALGGEMAELRERLAAPGDHALSDWLRTRKQDGVAFLLVVDQFEELFTLAEEQPRQRFDALLAHALQDPDCPLFAVSTVRADFLDRFEALPRLQAIYNSHCRRYFLPTISARGLRDCIEQPARLAGLNVDEVLVPLLDQAHDEAGALPLVENALFVLWNKRAGDRLSGQYLHDAGGLAGMLSSQADALLARIERELGAKARKGALELLLGLTRINDEGRHTRQRISRDGAVMVAGAGDDKVGERIVQLLSGERRADAPGGSGVLRLVTVTADQELDLIHETLIRTRGKDAQTGKPLPYWPALHDYIEANRDRDLQRQQLALQARRWRDSGGFGRWQNRAGWGELVRFRRLPLARGSLEARFLRWSGRVAAIEGGLLLVLLGCVGVLLEGLWWIARNEDQTKFPLSYAVHHALWRLGRGPVPEFVDIAPRSFTMGCKPGRDDVEGASCTETDRAHRVTLTRPYALGRYEVSFVEYDYYVWDMKRKGKGEDIDYPPDAGGREDRPVINVSWDDAKAYAAWLSHRLGLRGDEVVRLPTEAEWEFAARANTDTAYWWGRDFDRGKAVCGGGDRTLPIGSGTSRANPWGLQDMLGNVFEWTEDWYASYQEADVTDPVGPPAGGSRVLRGGSWGDDPGSCRAADRYSSPPGNRYDSIGFRVCRGSPIEPLATAPLDAGPLKR